MGRRLAYTLSGFVAGFLLAVVLRAVKVEHFETGWSPVILGISVANLSLWMRSGEES
jgi:hypothetical protein